MLYDLIVRGGRVVDPVHARDAVLDIGIVDGKVLDVDSISDGRDTTAGTRARGDAAVDRGAVDLGQKRFIAPERVRFVGIGLRPQPTALEQGEDTTGNHRGHLRRRAARSSSEAGKADSPHCGTRRRR